MTVLVPAFPFCATSLFPLGRVNGESTPFSIPTLKVNAPTTPVGLCQEMCMVVPTQLATHNADVSKCVKREGERRLLT